MSTQLRIFKADAGLKWFKAGWLIFKIQPATFIFMHLFIAIVGLVSLLSPLLQVAAAFATPFLTAGFYQAVLTKQQGGKIMLADVLKPFSAKGNRLGLVRLALYQMGAGILMALLASGLFKDAFALMSQPGLDASVAIEQVIQSISGYSVVLFLIAMTVYIMAFAYALPLVYFSKEQRILVALKQSLMAFYHNLFSLGIFGIICALLMALSAFLSFLPLLILMPICYISFFVSYQAIFMPVVPPSDDKNVTPLSDESNGRFDA